MEEASGSFAVRDDSHWRRTGRQEYKAGETSNTGNGGRSCVPEENTRNPQGKLWKRKGWRPIPSGVRKAAT